tara:strand:- start:4298 stop:4489 length:192 start_codon:yes stop_codon:yes gene_type:complete
MGKNSWDLVKLIDYQDNDVYVNKNHITRIHENSQKIIEIQLVNQTTVFIKDINLDLLIDKLSI